MKMKNELGINRPSLATMLLGGAVLLVAIGYLYRATTDRAAVTPKETFPRMDSIGPEAEPEVATGPMEPVTEERASEPQPPSSAAQRQFLRERLAELDMVFSEDSIDPAWSGSMRDKIAAAISTSEAQAGMRPGDVVSQDIECRARACRINLAFPDDRGDDMAPLVLLQLSSEFPAAVTVPVQHENGAMEYHLYLAANKTNRLMGKSKVPAIASSDNQGHR